MASQQDQTPNPAHIFTLHRYFIWADRMRWHFDRVLEQGQAGNPNWEVETRLYMSYWYGGLYVVIEGWQELGLKDETVEKLLESPNVSLLRRFRNGSFHFQRDYDDPRFLDLIVKGKNIVEWIRSLRQAYSEFFLKWFGGRERATKQEKDQKP